MKSRTAGGHIRKSLPKDKTYDKIRVQPKGSVNLGKAGRNVELEEREEFVRRTRCGLASIQIKQIPK